MANRRRPTLVATVDPALRDFILDNVARGLSRSISEEFEKCILARVDQVLAEEDSVEAPDDGD